MWERIIVEVCQRLEAAGIRYHADASSSFYVNGFMFDMRDFDVTVEWGKIDSAHALFTEYNPTPISNLPQVEASPLESRPKRFCFQCKNHAIDVMSYESPGGIGPHDERTLVDFSGYKIWTKVPSFYLERMSADHPLRSAAVQYFSAG